MQFYIDSADIKQIREVCRMGLVDGVTTNPSLIAKTGRSHHKVIKEICSEVKGLVSAEVVSTETHGMVEEGKALAQIADNVVVKIPMTEPGLVAVRQLSEQKIKTNVTLVFNPIQAIMAAKAGATLVSPFVGRLDDIGVCGMDMVSQIIQCYNNYKWNTQVLVASVRGPLHLLKAALLGAHIATVPFKVLKNLVSHPLTDKGLEQFLKDAQSTTRL